MSPRELDPGLLDRELSPVGGGAAPSGAGAGGPAAACTWSFLYDLPEIVGSRDFAPDDVAAAALEAAVKIAGAERCLLLLHGPNRDLGIRAAIGLPRELEAVSPAGMAVNRAIEDALRLDRAVLKEHAPFPALGGRLLRVNLQRLFDDLPDAHAGIQR